MSYTLHEKVFIQMLADNHFEGQIYQISAENPLLPVRGRGALWVCRAQPAQPV
jgi:hypothetical protein